MEVIFMPAEKNPFTDPDMKKYFMSLSPVIKESIEQSGVKFESISQLQSFVKNLDNNNT
jgi:hypothetical protein